MPSEAKALIFIPTYNERENVEPMCKELLNLELNADILFLDDNSPDGTGAILAGLAKSCPRISVIHRTGKLGIGSAHAEGVAYAYRHGYTLLITMDCDFTHSPGDIGRLLSHADTHDIVVASRYLQSNSLPGWNPLRKFLTHFGHFLTKFLLGMPHDATGAFRVYRLDRISPEVFNLVKSRGYSYFFESLFLLTRNGATIAEVPIALPARTYGHSKMSYRDAGHSAFQVFSLYLADRINPAQFHLDIPITDINPTLSKTQGWDDYWTRKDRAAKTVYDLIAASYRNLVIKPNLSAAIHKHFPPGSHLLHIGCGGGQIDVDLHRHVKITAMDVSIPALQLYAKNNPWAFAVKHGSAFALTFPDESFDGVYNLGLLEHFPEKEIQAMIGEFNRVLKPGGKLVVFWPHRRAASVFVLKVVRWIFKELLNREIKLHPEEISLLRSRRHGLAIIQSHPFQVIDYSFGIRDFFVQAVIVGKKL